jgi:hypothetical protein
MDRHGIDRFMFGQPEGMDFSQIAIRCLEKGANGIVRIGILEEDPHISIEKLQVIIITVDQNRPAPVPPFMRRDETIFSENLLHNAIDGEHPIRAFSQGAQNPEPIEQLKNLLGFFGLQVISKPMNHSISDRLG